MESFLKRFFFSPFPYIIIIPILIISITFSFVQGSLEKYRGKLEKDLAHYLGFMLQIRDLRYSFPDYLTLKDVSFYQTDASGDYQHILLKEIKLKFAVGKYITKRGFSIKKIGFKELDAVFIGYPVLIKESIQKIVKLINSLPKEEEITITFKDMQISFSFRGDLMLCLAADTQVTIGADNVVTGSGSIGIRHVTSFKNIVNKDLISAGELLSFSLVTKFVRDGMLIQNLEFKKQSFSAKLWGELHGDILKINGFSFLGRGVKDDHQEESEYGLADNIKRIAGFKMDEPFEFITKSSGDLNILDISSVIKLKSQGIDIESMDFNINNIPYHIEASLDLAGDYTIRAIASSFKDEPEEKRLLNPKRFDLEILGSLKDKKFNGKLIADYLRITKTKRSPSRFILTFKNLTVGLPQSYGLDINFERLDLQYRVGLNPYEIFLEDFNASFIFERGSPKVVHVDSMIFDGHLKGEARVESFGPPLLADFKFDIQDVSSDLVRSLSRYFCKVYGPLSGSLNFKVYPKFELFGSFVIDKGYLDHLRFFTWLADSFDLPSLYMQNFDSLKADFLVNDEAASLSNININASDLTLTGDFRLQENDLVSSTLSLRLSKALLESSSKLKPLRGIFKKEADDVMFDFKLSGLFDRMNFQWTESPFKTRVREAFPDFIENIIERRIERVIEPRPVK